MLQKAKIRGSHALCKARPGVRKELRDRRINCHGKNTCAVAVVGVCACDFALLFFLCSLACVVFFARARRLSCCRKHVRGPSCLHPKATAHDNLFLGKMYAGRAGDGDHHEGPEACSRCERFVWGGERLGGFFVCVKSDAPECCLFSLLNAWQEQSEALKETSQA